MSTDSIKNVRPGDMLFVEAAERSCISRVARVTKTLVFMEDGTCFSRSGGYLARNSGKHARAYVRPVRPGDEERLAAERRHRELVDAVKKLSPCNLTDAQMARILAIASGETTSRPGVDSDAYVLKRQCARHNAKREEEVTMSDFDKTQKAWDAYDMAQAYEDGAADASASQWIPVEERLPEVYRTVLAYIDSDDFRESRLALAHWHGKDWHATDGHKIRPSHWMYIPPIPKKVRQKC